MKKINYIIAAALAVLACSCAKEQVVETVPAGDEVRVSFAAEIPGVQTKAGDGLSATNLAVAVYENAKDASGNDIPGAYIPALDKSATFTALKADVNFNLVKGKTYHFIFWAQADNAPYTFAKDAKTVSIDYSGTANDESRDAFYAVKTLKVMGPAAEPVQLKRPFAQVNFGTADFDDAVIGGVEVTKSTFTATDAATTLDLFAGEGKDEADITYTEKELPTETLVLKDGTRYKWMAMNYFVPAGKFAESHVSNVKAEFISASHTVEVSAPSAPVQANWRTNIVGNLLTDQVIFNVEIIPAFENDTDLNITSVSTVAELRTALEGGNSAKLEADVELDETISIPDGKDVVIDLDGHTLSNADDLWDQPTAEDNNWSLLSVKGGKLTIKGNGVFKAKENDCYAVDVQDGGVVVIEDGEYVGNIHAVYVHTGTAIIKGGKFSVQQKYPQAGKADEFVLNCYDANRKAGTASIVVYGGEFKNFNPADCYAEGAHTNFLAPGYKTVKNGDVYTVVEAVPVSTSAELEQAIANAADNDVIYLKAGTYDDVIDIRGSKTITFKPAVAGTTVVLAGVNCASNNTATACTFEGITFDNSIQTAGWFTGTASNTSPCVGAWGGKLNFKNCKFIVDGSSKKETGVMTWWTLETCPTSLSFEGCTFEGKNGHAEARAMQIYGHVNLTVDGCTLRTAKRYAIKYAGNENYTATIRNNNVSGCEYTVELGSSVYPGSKYTVNFANNTLASGIADYYIAHAENATINGGVAK